MPILQAYTIVGHIIGKARWQIESFQNLHVEDIVQISVLSNDKELLAWLKKNQSVEIGIEKSKENKNHSIILSFRILKFRHMVENNTNNMAQMDSMAQIIPMNRSVEQVLIYILDPEKSDPRFKSLLRQIKN